MDVVAPPVEDRQRGEVSEADDEDDRVEQRSAEQRMKSGQRVIPPGHEGCGSLPSTVQRSDWILALVYYTGHSRCDLVSRVLLARSQAKLTAVTD